MVQISPFGTNDNKSKWCRFLPSVEMTDVAEKKNRGRVGGEAAHSPSITIILWAVISTAGRNL